ncbi:Maf family protein, partial [Mycobacterium talmoniae]
APAPARAPPAPHPRAARPGDAEAAARAGLGPDVAPDAVVAALASAKADAVTRQLPAEVAADCVVVGCDSMLLLDGHLRGKPASLDAARAQWQSMAGRSGQLHTGHCLIRLQHRAITDRKCETVVTTVHFGTPTTADLDAYLDSGEPLQVAGGFTLDGLGGWFIDGVDGDPSSVIGISLPLLRTLLGRVGLSIAELWAT